MEDTFNSIQQYISSNDVVLFMKGTKDLPMCGFSSFVASILKGAKVEFLDVNVLDDNNIREGIKKFSNWPTIPQLYIKKEFIGGCDIVKEMYESGELYKTLDSFGISYAKAE